MYNNTINRSKFGARIFESKIFQKQMCRIEESTYGIVGSFRRSHSDPATGELLSLCPPSLRP